MSAEIIYRDGTEGKDKFYLTRDKTVPQSWEINSKGGDDILSAELIFADDNFTFNGGSGNDNYTAGMFEGKGSLVIIDSTGNDGAYILLPANSFKAIINGLSVNKTTGTINLKSSDLNIAIDARIEWVQFIILEEDVTNDPNTPRYYLTEDVFKGIIRKATFEEMNFRTYGANQDWYLKNLDTASLWNKRISAKYSMSFSTTLANEGWSVQANIFTSNVPAGTKLYYSIGGTGITYSDILADGGRDADGKLYIGGSRTVGQNGQILIDHKIVNDQITEGDETLVYDIFIDEERLQKVATSSLVIKDTSLDAYYNKLSNNLISAWKIYPVDNSVNADDIISQWFKVANPAIPSLIDTYGLKLMEVSASTWRERIAINRVAKAADTGGKIEAKQIYFTADEVAGSVISGGNGNDDIKGYAGWDFLDGGAGDDLIHGGNGRDILTGGTGRDELHGDFGWNTYKSEKDGVSDLVAIKSDQFLVNWLYGKAGNSPNGEKSDIIEGLDAIDKIRIIGIDTSEITFAANVSAKGVTGIGIYGKGILEALYTGGDLTLAQIQSMTSGDASAAAMSNSVNAYGVW